MRYIGNKAKLLMEIDNMLISKGIKQEGLTFCDAFSGTATVGDYFNGFYKISTLFPLYYKAFISPIFRLFLVSFISLLSENTASKKRVSFLLVRFWYAVKSAMYLSISTVEFFIKIFLWYSTVNNYKALV